jgi:hypothetical protein
MSKQESITHFACLSYFRLWIDVSKRFLTVYFEILLLDKINSNTRQIPLEPSGFRPSLAYKKKHTPKKKFSNDRATQIQLVRQGTEVKKKLGSACGRSVTLVLNVSCR